MFGTIKPGTMCKTCSTRQATKWWTNDGIMAAIHGGAIPRCERCCIVDQLAHARKMAAKIPELEARLASLP